MSSTRALVVAPLASACTHGLGPAASIDSIDRVDIEGACRT
jgi:hypothetical protein